MSKIWTRAVTAPVVSAVRPALMKPVTAADPLPRLTAPTIPYLSVLLASKALSALTPATKATRENR